MKKKTFAAFAMFALALTWPFVSCSGDDDDNNGSDSSTSEMTFKVGKVSFKMVPVEGGAFTMGSETTAFATKPEHDVRLSDFYIGETEVTQELWMEVMGSNPAKFTNSVKCPVENVSWNDCQEFIKKLNEKTSKTFRLPTEAEWEYAARGGNNPHKYKYAGSQAIDDVAWYEKNSDKTTHEVKKLTANELGLFDMTGNVEEWCDDWYGTYPSEAQTNPTGPESGRFRVLRGGSWTSSSESAVVTMRNRSLPDYQTNLYGLRLAMSK